MFDQDINQAIVCPNRNGLIDSVSILVRQLDARTISDSPYLNCK